MKGFDSDRCQITSIEHTERGVEVALVISTSERITENPTMFSLAEEN